MTHDGRSILRKKGKAKRWTSGEKVRSKGCWLRAWKSFIGTLQKGKWAAGKRLVLSTASEGMVSKEGALEKAENGQR